MGVDTGLQNLVTLEPAPGVGNWCVFHMILPHVLRHAEFRRSTPNGIRTYYGDMLGKAVSLAVTSGHRNRQGSTAYP